MISLVLLDLYVFSKKKRFFNIVSFYYFYYYLLLLLLNSFYGSRPWSLCKYSVRHTYVGVRLKSIVRHKISGRGTKRFKLLIDAVNRRFERTIEVRFTPERWRWVVACENTTWIIVDIAWNNNNYYICIRLWSIQNINLIIV